MPELVQSIRTLSREANCSLQDCFLRDIKDRHCCQHLKSCMGDAWLHLSFRVHVCSSEHHSNLPFVYRFMSLLYDLLLRWCFMALQHFSGHFGRGQLTYPHCSWASLLGSLPVTDNCPSWISGWERNYFMTNLHDRMWPYVRMEPATARIPVGRASDRATAPGALWLGYIDHTHVHIFQPISPVFAPP